MTVRGAGKVPPFLGSGNQRAIIFLVPASTPRGMVVDVRNGNSPCLRLLICGENGVTLGRVRGRSAGTYMIRELSEHGRSRSAVEIMSACRVCGAAIEIL